MSVHDEVLAAAKDMLRKGLTAGTSGNVSGRTDDGHVVITPSSIDYEEMTLADLVVLDMDGKVVEGTRSPSSEKSVHLASYRRYPEIGSVIHAHPVYASMFAVARQPISSGVSHTRSTPVALAITDWPSSSVPSRPATPPGAS